MAKKRLLKLIFWAMSAPQLAMSRWMEGLSSGTFRSDLGRCLDYVDRHQNSVPPVLIDALVAAEDHRSEYHRGVDPIGMFRALWVRIFSGHVQGASTIEQQFVRVVTGRYERTLLRKLREQLLAIALARHRGKRAIASAYLAIAFYGSGCSGLAGLKARFGPHLDEIGERQALRFVSQLKYPRPWRPGVPWHERINARTEALWERRGRAANPSLERTRSSITPPPFPGSLPAPWRHNAARRPTQVLARDV
ncbi:MAG: biosynthetic peptidoglycan transglycosylase [Candidatus Binatia bacterium]